MATIGCRFALLSASASSASSVVASLEDSSARVGTASDSTSPPPQPAIASASAPTTHSCDRCSILFLLGVARYVLGVPRLVPESRAETKRFASRVPGTHVSQRLGPSCIRGKTRARRGGVSSPDRGVESPGRFSARERSGGQIGPNLDAHGLGAALESSSFQDGARRDRTADLLNAIQALSQLSYSPIFVSTAGRTYRFFALAATFSATSAPSLSKASMASE